MKRSLSINSQKSTSVNRRNGVSSIAERGITSKYASHKYQPPKVSSGNLSKNHLPQLNISSNQNQSQNSFVNMSKNQKVSSSNIYTRRTSNNRYIQSSHNTSNTSTNRLSSQQKKSITKSENPRDVLKAFYSQIEREHQDTLAKVDLEEAPDQLAEYTQGIYEYLKMESTCY